MTSTEKQLIEKLEDCIDYQNRLIKGLYSLVSTEEGIHVKEDRDRYKSEITALKQQVEQEEKTVSDEEIKEWLKTRPDLMSYSATPYFICAEFRDKLLNK
jgi:hypothetical protein